MAGPWYVDDGGDGTTEDSWATADTSIKDLDAEKVFANGEIVYFGADSVDGAAAGVLSIIGVGTGAVTFISATQGSSPPTYAEASAYQINTGGTNRLTFANGFGIYGMWIRAGESICFSTGIAGSFYAEDTTFRLGANGQVIALTTLGSIELVNCTIDLTDDGTTNRTAFVFTSNIQSEVKCVGLSFINSGYRTAAVFGTTVSGMSYIVSGADFSGLASSCELVDAAAGSFNVEITNSLTAATWTPIVNAVRCGSNITLVNVGPADAPTYIYNAKADGTCVSSSAIYRTGGATVETETIAWLITTTTSACESTPYKSPWIYGEVASTGSKTFDVYTTNDTADFTDAEVWLEVEYLGTADEANTTLASDHRTITTTAANQTDDTTSTWNGTGPSFTYKQKLSVTATVNETGMYRARVVVGVASIASSRYFYIDPKVTVS